MQFQERDRLRKVALSLRSNLTETMQDEFSSEIGRKAVEYILAKGFRKVHSYLSYRSEVETLDIIKELLAHALQVSVPIVVQDNGNETLSHSVIENISDIKPGRYGIPVPRSIQIADLSNLDAVLIPVVAFDNSGMRLGYGKGFYDRFLSSIRPGVERIGLAYSLQEVGKIPKNSHDELMNQVITEKTTFFF